MICLNEYLILNISPLSKSTKAKSTSDILLKKGGKAMQKALKIRIGNINLRENERNPFIAFLFTRFQNAKIRFLSSFDKTNFIYVNRHEILSLFRKILSLFRKILSLFQSSEIKKEKIKIKKEFQAIFKPLKSSFIPIKRKLKSNYSKINSYLCR